MAVPVTEPAIAKPGYRGTTILFAFMLMLVTVVVRQKLGGPVADTSWLITVIERMAAGERLYVDLIETNPPFSVWLYMVPVKLAFMIGSPAELMVDIWTYLACLFGVGLFCKILASQRLVGTGTALGGLVILFALVTLLAGSSFTERDQIGAVLALPFFALTAWRADPGRSRDPSIHYWFAAGIAGSVLPLVKPYYVPVILGSAIWLSIKRRDLSQLFCPEYLIAGGLFIVYMVCAYLVYPEYFISVLPLLEDTYMAFSYPLSIGLLMAYPGLCIAMGYVLTRHQGQLNSLAQLLLVASVIAWIPFFIQGKYWIYHYYPAVLFGSVSLLVRSIGYLCQCKVQPDTNHPSAINAIAVGLMILMANWRIIGIGSHHEILRPNVPANESREIGFIGGNIAAFHPLARTLGGVWAEPYCSDWVAIYAIRLMKDAISVGNRDLEAKYRAILDEYVAAKRQRYLENLPDTILIDRSDELTSYLLKSASFGVFVNHYNLAGSHGQTDILQKPALD